MILPSSLSSLVSQKHWVIWKRRNDAKVPFQARHPERFASTTDPKTWASFEQARGNNIGFVLLGSGIGALDLDDCRDPETGALINWARDLIHQAGSYVEITPSGCGLRIIGTTRGGPVHRTIPMTVGKVEVYRDCPRYITVTGNELGECRRLNSIDEVIDKLVGSTGRDETDSGYGLRFFEDQYRAGHNYSQALRAIKEYRGRAGDWSRKVDARQHQRAWDEAVKRVSSGKYYLNGGRPQIEMVRVADVAMKRTEWVWPGRLARGKVTIFSGEPFIGKSLITNDMAARVTNKGLKWPDGAPASFGSVVMLAAEDAISDTVRPRLEAAGANIERVHVVKMVVDEKSRRLFKLQTDLGELEERIKQIKDVVLVIIDPISSYMGEKEGNSITTFRPVMEMLADFAERANVAVAVIHHPPKTAAKALHAFSGSLAFIAAPRIGFIVVVEPETERRLVLCVGTNLGKKPNGLAFTIGATMIGANASRRNGVLRVNWGIETSKLSWDTSPVTTTASEALSAMANSHEKKDNAEGVAIDFLKRFLADGEAEFVNVRRASETEKINLRTLYRAADRLNVKRKRLGVGKSRSLWSL